MFPLARSACLLTLSLCTATASLAQDYSRDPALCRNGSLITDAPEGLIIGNGTVLIDGMNCTRVSDRRPLADGWYNADWECEAEGEPYGTLTFDLRITDALVQVRSGDRVTDYPRCP